MDIKKFLILLTIFIDVLGLTIVIPVMPFYVESFKVSAFFVSLLFTVYPLFSFFNTPFLGMLSDKYGRRPILLTSIFSTSLGWLIFANAKNIWMLFVGRIIDGLAAGNIASAQSYLSDLSKDDKERTSNFSLMGVIFGISFVIGPAIGGWLSGISLNLPFWIVGILSFLNFLFALKFLPEVKHTHNPSQGISFNPIKPIVDLLTNKNLRKVYFIWLIFGLSLSLQQSIFALFLEKAFNYQATTVGHLMAIVGLMLIINQAFLLKRIWLVYFRNENLISIMLFILGIAFFLMSTRNVLFLILSLLLMSISQSTFRAVLNTVALQRDPSKTGQILGTLNSLFSLSSIIGPIIGGVLFHFNIYLPLLFSGFLLILISFFTYLFL
jgi:DHA1 family tetracycline resistance protein-like MFS transporter